MKLPFFARLVFNRYFFEKFAAITSLAFLLWFLDGFLFVFLITFLFAYLFLDLSEWIVARFSSWIRKLDNSAFRRLLVKMNRLPIVVTLVYAGFLALVIGVISGLIPHILDESKGLMKEIPEIASNLEYRVNEIESAVGVDFGLQDALSNVLSSSNVEATVKNVFENVRATGILLGKIIISIVLSYVFIIDRTKIFKYLEGLKHGNFSFLFHEYSLIFGKIAKGFGLIFKAQSIIACVNAILTTIGLIVISLIHGGTMFPYIATIGVFVFIMGFVPVLGFLISSLPILLIGYNYGGATVTMEIVIMIAVVHAVESYYLNPKIVSSYMEFPVFVTFLVLLISEHLFGFIGLLIGVPLFYIAIDTAKDVDGFIEKLKRVSSAIDTTKSTTKEAIHKNIRLSRSQGSGQE